MVLYFWDEFPDTDYVYSSINLNINWRILIQKFY